MPDQIYWWRLIVLAAEVQRMMIFCAIGKDPEEARARLIAEHAVAPDENINEGLKLIPASEPFINEVKNGTFSLAINVRVAPE